MVPPEQHAPVIWRLIGIPLLGYAAIIVQGATETRFQNTVTTGSILLAALVMVAAGLFTIRSNVAKTWQNAWQAEKSLRAEKEAELARCQAEILTEREEQQHVRHELKDEIATLRAQITLLEAKTDLSSLEHTAATRHSEILAAIERLASPGA